MKEFLAAVFPQVSNGSASAYSQAGDKAAGELGIPYDVEQNISAGVDIDSRLFRLMFEMNEAGKELLGSESSLIQNEEYKHYTGTLVTFCNPSNGSLKGWLKPASETNRISKSFDAALFYSYLLLNREECAATRSDFLEKCLGYLGVSGIEEPMRGKLFAFDWDELGEKGEIGGRRFTRLKNRAILCMGVASMLIMGLIGTYSAEQDEAKLKKFYAMLQTAFAGELKAAELFESAERALLNSNKFFEPRSIQTTRKLYPQDYFVVPRFCCGKTDADSPVARIKNASRGQKLMIMAKTGLGKSTFLQMVTLCMLKNRYGIGGDQEALARFSEKLDVPSDMYIISVPARMFSYCYGNDRYDRWTTDFVTLFFNSMWKLSSGVNFYSTQTSQRFSDEKELTAPDGELTVTGELQAYISQLARAGKLLLILDSFDEISSGEMRAAYLNALAAFHDKYCDYRENGEVGAHVIVSSRKMSPETMRALERALWLDMDTQTFDIKPLNREQRQELVHNWKHYDEEVAAEILEQIEQNHYYLDYSVNPYMLSVVCAYSDRDLGDISQRLITTLLNRMIKNNRTDPVIRDVLANISKILQDIAGETITRGKPHFSRRRLDRYLRGYIDKTDLLEEDVERYIEKLHEIFVTEVGLIVPADGDDSDYQFVNDQIRFELAARGIERALQNDEKTAVYREVIFPSIQSLEEYVGLLVPLVCNLNLENVQLAELLVSDLVMYDFRGREQDALIVQTLMDFLLKRYGGSILTIAEAGDTDAGYIRRAQRLLLMRLLTSPAFAPTRAEKEELRACAAYTCNREWLSERVTAILE